MRAKNSIFYQKFEPPNNSKTIFKFYFRDAILYCLSLPQLTYDSESVPKALIGLMKSSLSSESSFVRKASLIFLEKLWTIEKDLIEDVHNKIEKILQNETEAIVRRQSVEFVIQCLNQNGPTNDLMMLGAVYIFQLLKNCILK